MTTEDASERTVVVFSRGDEDDEASITGWDWPDPMVVLVFRKAACLVAFSDMCSVPVVGMYRIVVWSEF